MVRGSDKHSPRIDDGLAHDTRPLTQGAPLESRADGAREQEGAGDGEPTTDALLSGGPDHDATEERSRLAAALRPSIWPADREALVRCARDNGAAAEVVDRLRGLPDGTFSHTEAVWEALGGRVESRP